MWLLMILIIFILLSASFLVFFKFLDSNRGTIFIYKIIFLFILIACIAEYFALTGNYHLLLNNESSSEVAGIWFFHMTVVSWALACDYLGNITNVLLSTITSLIVLYSSKYMKGDKNLIKFVVYLSFFYIAMILVINAQNLFIFFLGWEGVALMSYLLINFWDNKLEASRAAMKALILNKIEDAFLMAATVILSALYFCSSFVNINIQSIFINSNMKLLIQILILCAVCIKSVQIILNI